MSVTIGPRIPAMISAGTGDSYSADLRKFLRHFHALIQCSVKSKTLTAPPGSPANGDAYIIAASATGAWSGHDKAIGLWTTDDPVNPSGVWEFYGPTIGFLAFNQADSTVYAYDGTTWGALAGGGGGSSTLAGDTDVTLTSPANGDVLTYDSGTSKWENQVPGAGSSKPFAQAQGRTFAVVADGTSGIHTFTPIGDVPLNTKGIVFTDGEVPQTSPLRGCGSSRKHATTDSYAGWYGSQLYFAGLDFVNASARIWMGRTTDIRMWITMSSVGFGGLTVSDTPTGSYAGFRFSAIGGDTHIQCCTSDGSTQTVVSSGVAADTAAHSYGIQFVDGTPAVKFYIDGVLVATITTTLPASGTPLSLIAFANWHTAVANPLIGAEAFYVQTHGG